MPHPGAVTERVSGEGREGAARRRRECRGRRAGHAEAAQQARRAAEEPGGEHGDGGCGGGGCGGGHGGSADARYISAAVASPAVRSGRPPLYASATADTVRLPSALHVSASYLVSLSGRTVGSSAYMSETGFICSRACRWRGRESPVVLGVGVGRGRGRRGVCSSEHSVHLEESCSEKGGSGFTFFRVPGSDQDQVFIGFVLRDQVFIGSVLRRSARLQ